MMLSRLAAQDLGVPNLVVAQRVIHRMAAAANRFIQDETGEAMIGLLVPGTNTNGVDTLYVLDTISPDESAVRAMHTFQQGDERQDELIWWLQENWRCERERRSDLHLMKKWDVPLRYLGDWHKQPGMMIHPSSGDLMTALNWIDDPDNQMDFLLAPIVTVDHPPREYGSSANYLSVPQGNGFVMRVDFWYIDQRQRTFLPITPSVYPNMLLPSLQAYPWHLVNEARFADEMARLNTPERLTTLILWDADGKAPLEICFLTLRLGADKLLLLITSSDYPAQPPNARIAPLVDMSGGDMYRIFEQAWTQSEPVTPPTGWQWTADKTLADFVTLVETSLGIAPATGTQPEAAANER